MNEDVDTKPKFVCPNCSMNLFDNKYTMPVSGMNNGVRMDACLQGDYEIYSTVIPDGQVVTIYEVFVFPDVRVRLGKAYTIFGEANYALNYKFRMSVTDVKRIGSNWKVLRNIL